jgi:ketosteroid isomerase-like protein
MMRETLIIAAFVGLYGLTGCTKNENTTTQTQTGQKMSVTVDTLKQILDAFNRHDLDAIMEFFSEDCSFDFPRGPDPWGQRFHGKAQVREALAGRFKGIPDVHYGEDSHWISQNGDHGLSEWTLTGTSTAGFKLKVRGCDLWTFRDGKVIRKDSYWKIIEPANTAATR